MHYINGDGGIKNPKEKLKFVNLLTENAKYKLIITINAIYERVSILLGSQWLGGREADIEGTVRV